MVNFVRREPVSTPRAKAEPEVNPGDRRTAVLNGGRFARNGKKVLGVDLLNKQEFYEALDTGSLPYRMADIEYQVNQFIESDDALEGLWKIYSSIPRERWIIMLNYTIVCAQEATKREAK